MEKTEEGSAGLFRALFVEIEYKDTLRKSYYPVDHVIFFTRSKRKREVHFNLTNAIPKRLLTRWLSVFEMENPDVPFTNPFQIQ